MELRFQLKHQEIKRLDRNVVASGSRNYVTARFIPITDDWSGIVTAIFDDYLVVLDENLSCHVPYEVLQNKGQFSVSAFCGDLHTATAETVLVMQSGYRDGIEPGEPAPDVYSQIVSMVNEAVETANSVREDADAGLFIGPEGPAGETGATGPQGPAGENGLAAYGGMYSSAGTTVSLTTTPTPLTLATALPSKNVTDGTNQLTVTNAGDYEINYGLLGSINTASTVTLTVAANGTPVTSATTTGNYEADEEFNLAGSTIATLAAGDVITLLGSAGASVTLTPNGGTNAYVTVKQLNTPAP